MMRKTVKIEKEIYPLMDISILIQEYTNNIQYKDLKMCHNGQIFGCMFSHLCNLEAYFKNVFFIRAGSPRQFQPPTCQRTNGVKPVCWCLVSGADLCLEFVSFVLYAGVLKFDWCWRLGRRAYIFGSLSRNALAQLCIFIPTIIGTRVRDFFSMMLKGKDFVFNTAQ